MHRPSKHNPNKLAYKHDQNQHISSHSMRGVSLESTICDFEDGVGVGSGGVKVNGKLFETLDSKEGEGDQGEDKQSY